MGKETAFHKACTDDFLELLKDQEVSCLSFLQRSIP
jgi:hypothetical protein